MIYGSTFSGIGGADLGFHRAGWKAAFFAESDAYRRRVLERHWPGVPVYQDVRDVHGEDAGWGVGPGAERGDADGAHGEGRRRPGSSAARLDEDVRGVGRAELEDDRKRRGGDIASGGAAETEPWLLDCLVGGFPCQDLSVAGKRAGLAGARSGLFFEFARIAGELVRPAGWIVIENVPGLLTSHDGRDFGVLLRTLGDIGFHDLAWRVLDSRYFGVPQRRRRLFIVARRAAGECAQAVLLEREGCGWDFASGGPSWAGVASGARDGVAGDVAGTVRSHVRPGSNDSGGVVAAPLTAGGHEPGVSAPGRRQEDDENLVADEGVVTQALTTRFGTASGADLPDAEANWLVSDEMVSAPVTAKWAKGNGGPAGDETQNLTFERSHRSTDGVEPDKWTETPVAPTLNDHDLGNGTRATALVTRAFHAYHGYEETEGVQTLLGGGSGGCLSLHDAPVLVEPVEDEVVAHTLRSEGFDASEDGTGRGTPLVVDEGEQQAFNVFPDGFGQSADLRAESADVSMTLETVGFAKKSDRGTRVVQFDGVPMSQRIHDGEADAAPTLTSSKIESRGGSEGMKMHTGGIVRRLTPTECERLQALPDGWTYAEGPSLADTRFEPYGASGEARAADSDPVDYPPDGPRYAGCGDAVTATVSEWIADRIMRVRLA